MPNGILNSSIDFRTGTRDEYMSALVSGGVKDEDLYYVSKDIDHQSGGKTEIDSLYIGKKLVGDTYESQYLDNLSKRVTNPIGLIYYGMTLDEIIGKTGGSLSKVVDMMLFTDASPSIDECAMISGFIPSVDISRTGSWDNKNTVGGWIQNYASQMFTQDKYNRFYDLTGDVSASFDVVLDPSKSYEEYGADTDIYTGRMFVAVPHDTRKQTADGLKDVSTIVDKVFSKVYEGTGLTKNFDIFTLDLTFGGTAYPYKIYLFGKTQTVISRIDMEYYVTLL